MSKITVLTTIRKNKEILFGDLTNIVTKKVRDEKWREVAGEAKGLGIIGIDKSAEYFRTTTWQNWRRRTVVSVSLNKKNTS